MMSLGRNRKGQRERMSESMKDHLIAMLALDRVAKPGEVQVQTWADQVAAALIGTAAMVGPNQVAAAKLIFDIVDGGTEIRELSAPLLRAWLPNGGIDPVPADGSPFDS